jgi:hypothetical protein
MRRLPAAPIAALFAAALALPACSGDYCLRCVDPAGGRPDVEGCDDDRAALEVSLEAYEAEGFVCIIFDNP